ncbi:mechanosensitive ion channel family protein [Carbonactinospora thermoautotrophica]|uniref:MscS Mechanosensitive ion channel n=1 Tax=Carbonactinospora thermoautotrophica TaxID=1469144 RepID=A0A132MW25_9ACTN|nr:mechanosensitive ion channel family protein [Carbonactinospora thermoautotrophica]KWX02051.1 MscS Mechanosensitive ion channel [Carbonactinospora thermoautotrophica]MCX9189975.1 mechanosensitive ion channel family protein [Carbonactinospora thermoautotrophica]
MNTARLWTDQLTTAWNELITWFLIGNPKEGQPPGYATLLQILLIIVLALTLRWITKRVITQVINGMAEARQKERLGERKAAALGLLNGGLLLPGERRRQRAEAIGAILRSIASFVIMGVATLMVLEKLGLNLAPVLASAGVVGVALGFGAQNLVKDFLAGVFMILEDQFGVGDTIELDKVSGTVEDVGLRTTRLRDADGVVWYVRNGEILRVGNKSQGWARAIVDVQVDYSEDIDRVLEIVRNTASQVAKDPDLEPVILEEPEVTGVESITGEAMTIRVQVKTAPMQHSEVARELRVQLKQAFDREGVKVPVPQRAPAGDADAAV